MPHKRRIALLLASTALAAGSLGLAACGGDDAGGGGDRSGQIVIDGSSTVAPLSSAAAEAFHAENSGVDVEVRTSGTGGGFEAFCSGRTDISNASREIAADEVAACAAAGVAYEEFRVASDGITVATGAESQVGGDLNLTLEQLEAVWEPGSTIDNWSEIPNSGYNDVPLTLAGAGSQSGTYDFFNEVVLGEGPDGETVTPRQDYSASEDDNVTVRAVTGAPGGMGYFGYSYYAENQDRLRAFALNGVAPTPETITDGSYPLSRPLFIYVSDEALQRPEVAAFVRYYLENAVTLAEQQEYVPAPQEALDDALAKVPEA